MKLISEQRALDRIDAIKADLRSEVAEHERRAKSCLTCDTPGACCLDAHFVNVRISRLEAVKVKRTLASLPEVARAQIRLRIDDAIEKYGLTSDADAAAKTFACPLFEKGIGCLVHNAGKPVPCIVHACYQTRADLPSDGLRSEAELAIDRLNTQTYGRPQPLLPLPLAIRSQA